MNEEVFYGLDDETIDHKIGSLNSNFASSLVKNNNILDKDNTKDGNSKTNFENNIIQLKTITNHDENKNKLIKRSKFYDEAYNSKRTALPCERKKINLNVWGILKEAVTKDLSKFCVPGN